MKRLKASATFNVLLFVPLQGPTINQKALNGSFNAYKSFQLLTQLQPLKRRNVIAFGPDKAIKRFCRALIRPGWIITKGERMDQTERREGHTKSNNESRNANETGEVSWGLVYGLLCPVRKGKIKAKKSKVMASSVGQIMS